MRSRIALILGALLNLLPSLLHAPSVPFHPLKAYTKWGFDAGDTGWNSQEPILNPENVNAGRFGKVWQRTVDGQIYAQPLYMAHVAVAGRGIHDVVFAATEHNTVYAFDAASVTPPDDEPLWRTSLGPVVPSDLLHCNDLTPELGVTSTPVLDPIAGVLYVVPKTLEDGVQKWRLHALDIRTGRERPGWGFEIAGSVQNRNGERVAFDPAVQFSRCGLTLHNGRLSIAFGSHCDHPNTGGYHGWIFCYDALHPQSPPQVFCTSPDAPGDEESAAGIWMSGAAPAVDDRGDLIVITGNGLFDADLRGKDVGDSFVKIVAGGAQPMHFTGRSDDYFTPSNQEALTRRDADLGAGGVMALPLQVGSRTPRLLIGGGKDNLLRLLDGDHLGGFRGRSNPSAVGRALQEVKEPDGFWSSPAYYRTPAAQWVYAMPVHSTLRQYRLTVDRLGRRQLQEEHQCPFIAGYPSSTPVISSRQGDPDSGVVWLLSRGDNALHALLASDVSKELYNSNQNPGRDGLGSTVIKFTVPTVANGRVYVGGDGKLLAYGLNPLTRYNPHHFVLVGPHTVSQGAPITHQLWAVDAAGAPMSITRTVRVRARDAHGKEHDLPDLVFNGQCMAAWTRAYQTTGPRVLNAAPDEPLAVTSRLTVCAANPGGVDRFMILTPPRAAPGQQMPVTVRALDRKGHAVPFTGRITLTSSRCDRPELADQVSISCRRTMQKVVRVRAAAVGPQLLTAGDGRRSGAAVVSIVPRRPLKGRVLLGDWTSHQRIHAEIRLLDPKNHAHVVRRYHVVLEDDFSFTIAAPDGVFDVAVKPDHWLQQILKRIDTGASGLLQFNGPEGHGLLNGDADGDDRIDARDLALIQSRIGLPPDARHPLSDLDGGGVLNAADLALIRRNLGRHGDR